MGHAVVDKRWHLRCFPMASSRAHSRIRVYPHGRGEGYRRSDGCFAFFVLTSAVISAYASFPLYQLLEGYSMPSFLRNRLIRRQMREFARVKALERRFLSTRIMPPNVTIDDFRRFPDSLTLVRATQMGNVLTAMENWSRDRYHLDSQTMWYELMGVSNDRVRKEIDEARAPVDFFVSAIAHMIALAVLCIVVAFIPEARVSAVVIALIAFSTVPISYHFAIRNIIQWSLSVKAMVNLGRIELANSLGLKMPAKLEDEQEMWSAHYWTVELNQRRYFKSYNRFRRLPDASAAMKISTGNQVQASDTSDKAN